MAMVRISEQAMERLKALAAEGNRPLTNQLDELLGVRGMIEPIEVRSAEGNAAHKTEVFLRSKGLENSSIAPALRKEASFGSTKPIPKGKK